MHGDPTVNRKPVCPVDNVQVKSDNDNNSLVTLIQEHPWLPVVALIGDNDIVFLLFVILVLLV